MTIKEKTNSAERLTKKVVDLMAEWIVAFGRVDYLLCDEVPEEQHLKYFPANDGNYDNETCEKCIKEFFLNKAKRQMSDRNTKCETDIKHLSQSKTKEQNLLLCAEEAGEWIQAVSKMARGTPEERRYKRRRDKLIGETADLIICIGIIRQMYGIDDDELQEIIDYKMQRNLERIKG